MWRRASWRVASGLSCRHCRAERILRCHYSRSTPCACRGRHNPTCELCWSCLVSNPRTVEFTQYFSVLVLPVFISEQFGGTGQVKSSMVESADTVMGWLCASAQASYSSVASSASSRRTFHMRRVAPPFLPPHCQPTQARRTHNALTGRTCACTSARPPSYGPPQSPSQCRTPARRRTTPACRPRSAHPMTGGASRG
jgi:hypothetical protein